MADQKRVRMKSLQLDDGEGSYGFEHFKIKDGMLTVNEDTANAMVSQQPFQWARADESDKDLRARLDVVKETQAEIERQQRAALGIVREPLAHGDTAASVEANREVSRDANKPAEKAEARAQAQAEGGRE